MLISRCYRRVWPAEGRPSLPSRSVDHEGLGRQDLRKVETEHLLADTAHLTPNDRFHIGPQGRRQGVHGVFALLWVLEVELCVEDVENKSVGLPVWPRKHECRSVGTLCRRIKQDPQIHDSDRIVGTGEIDNSVYCRNGTFDLDLCPPRVHHHQILGGLDSTEPGTNPKGKKVFQVFLLDYVLNSSWGTRADLYKSMEVKSVNCQISTSLSDSWLLYVKRPAA